MSIVVNKTRLPVTQWQTESGSVVSISDARKRNAKSLSVALEPIQDLHGYSNPWVGGAGKNKFNQSDSNSLAVDVSGYALNDAKALAQLNTLQAGTYTLTWKAKIVQISPTATDPSTGRYGLYFRAVNNGVNFNVNGQLDVANPTAGQIITKSVTFTLTSDYVGKFAYFWIYCGRFASSGNPDTCNFYDVQIESGSTATSFEPYENICPISGRSSVTAVRDGKNLFDKSVAKTNNAYRQDDGTQTSSTISCYTDALGGFAPSTAYTISGTVTVAGSSTRIYFLDAQQNWISRSVPIYESSLPYTFTTPAHCRFVQIQCPMSVSDLSDVQLELGSTATAYEPYTGTTYSISWQDEAGTVYGGTLDVTTGVLTVTKLMFTANTSTMNNSEAYPGWKNAGVMANNPKGGQYVNAIVNVGKAYAINVKGSNDIIYLPEHLYNHMNQTDWIALAIDVQIVYELATPQIIQLSPNQIEMLMRNNTIWSDDGIVTVNYARIRS